MQRGECSWRNEKDVIIIYLTSGKEFGFVVLLEVGE